MVRAKKLGHPKAMKAVVLARYRETGRVDLACKAAGLGRQTHYNWIYADPQYKADFEKCRNAVVQLLEDEAMRRAVEGVPKPISVNGETKTIREYSDTLLIFMLKGAAPEKYRERYEHAISGPNGGPIQVEHRAYEIFRGRIISASARLGAGQDPESDQSEAS
jgi:hypothetical protein